MSYSEAEARIRRLLSRIADTERRMDSVQDKILRTRQDLAGFYQVGSDPCLTTLTGNVISAISPLANSSLKIVGHTSGIDYGTYSVPTGTYSIAIPGIDASDTSLDFTPIGPTSPRYHPTGSITYTQSITRCGSKTLLDMRAGAATGYGYFLGVNGCEHPIGSLTWVDSRIGTGTATVATNGNNWTSSCLLTNSYPAPPTCAVAIASTPIQFRMVGDGGGTGAQIVWKFTNPPVQFCPASISCALYNSVGPDAQTPYGHAAVTAKTCPAIDLSTKFDITFGVNDQIWHNSLAETLRFYEP